MKNREKYRDEIVKAYKNLGSCDFMIKTVNPLYSDGWECNDELCQRGECEACSKLFAFWLDEEYIEPSKPEVDWSNVPVDTLVRVRDYEHREWNLRYFKGIDKSNPEEKYEAWSNGATSKTANDSSNHWKYCELVEDEDGSN
nr:MAG TPA: hypothetical protein [Caudoviricetes sp.]